MGARKRLDQLVFERGLAESRERAKTSVMSGLVYVDGRRETKPGSMLSPDRLIELRGDKLRYVSRGGLKLERALSVFDADVSGLCCIDCGASTGGFTDCLLQNGAKCVTAVDVGYGQLAWSIRNDCRVTVMERTNARLLSPSMFDTLFDLAVMDLSFISLKLVLPAVHPLLTGSGRVICLIKPQFEAGREFVGKKGVVREPEVHVRVLEEFLSYAADADFAPLGLDYSPVKGPEGNIEYLGFLQKGERMENSPDAREVVRSAFISLQ